MTTLRSQLVSLALQWEQEFGVAPQVTSAVSEYDAALLLGLSEQEYKAAMRGATAVQRGHDFMYKGVRYQVKATRASGKPGSKITKVPQPRNYDWDQLIWLRYDPTYTVQEAWLWDVEAYRNALGSLSRVSPDHMRKGNLLPLRNEA